MVTETTENGNGYAGKGSAYTGLALGATALGLNLLSGGAFGGILGGRPPAGDPPWARDMNYERQFTERDAKIGKLESQLYTDQQVNGLLQSQVATLNAMTSPCIKQPVMAASEAALTAFKANATSTSNG